MSRKLLIIGITFAILGIISLIVYGAMLYTSGCWYFNTCYGKAWDILNAIMVIGIVMIVGGIATVIFYKKRN